MIKDLPNLLINGEIVVSSSTHHEVIKSHFKSFSENYRLIYYNQTILPVIHCTVCEKFWWLYKLYNNRARSNPRSNIENHTCVEAANQPTLVQLNTKELGSIRTDVSKEFASIIAKYPTISINSGVSLANDVSNFIADLTLKRKKVYNFDISRQLVSKELKLAAKSKANQNIEKFTEGFNQSSIVIDHWSSHGRNFFAILARTFDNELFDVVENIIHFAEANENKSAKGIYFI